MRFLLAILFALGLIGLILVIVFKGNNGPKAAPPLNLSSYVNTDASVRLSVDGVINAESEHRSYRITVNRTNVTMEVFGGYQNVLLKTQTYPNNQTAYTSYMKALNGDGFTHFSATKSGDERGICPTGNRYVYEVLQGDKTVYRSFSTSCGSSLGNFTGKASPVRSLFQAQVPDYSKLISNVNIY